MRPIIFLAFLIIFVSSPVAGIRNTCPPIPFVPESGGAGMARLNEWCKSVGGTPSNSGGNWSCVNCPASGTSTGTSTANPYEGLFGWLFSIDANAKIRAQRKAALIRQLEYDRQDAIRRQQTVQAEKLNSILQRLMSGNMALKGFGGANDLQLKLGSEPILFQEYMSTPATSKTSAQISLKTGNEAAPAVQPVASAAGATTTTAITSDLLKESQQLSPEMKALAEELSKLSPEQQQKLLEAIKSTETQTAANTTVATTSPEKVADTQLSLKLTDAKTVADGLNAATNEPGNPETVKGQASDQFNQLQKVTATQTKTDSRRSATAQPIAERKLVDGPNDRPKIQAPTKEDVALLFQDVAPGANLKSPVVAPQNSDLDLLFREELTRVSPGVADELLTAFQRQKSRWPGPVNLDGPLRNPLVEEEKWKNDPGYRGPRIQEALSRILEWPPATQERYFMVDFYGNGISGRYLSDKAFKAEADKIIDQKINDTRKYLIQAKIKAFDNSLSEMESLIQRYTPAGQPRDISKLTQNPAFLAERDRMLNSFEATERQAYTVDAKIRLGIYLELGLTELKNRP